MMVRVGSLVWGPWCMMVMFQVPSPGHAPGQGPQAHRLTPASTVRSAIERLPDTHWMSNLKDTHACTRSWVRCAQRAVIAPPPLAAPGTDETDMRMALPHKKALTTTPPAYIKDEHRRPTPRQHQETTRRKTVQNYNTTTPHPRPRPGHTTRPHQITKTRL